MTKIHITHEEAETAVSIVYDIASQVFFGSSNNVAHQIVLDAATSKRITDWGARFMTEEKPVVEGAQKSKHGLPFEVAEKDEGVMTWNEAMKPRADGWRLPTKEELNQMYEKRHEISGFNLTGSNPAGWYWSSSPFNDYRAWGQWFGTGYQYNFNRFNDYSVRCVR